MGNLRIRRVIIFIAFKNYSLENGGFLGKIFFREFCIEE